MSNKVLIISDNLTQIQNFVELVSHPKYEQFAFDYAYSHNNKALDALYKEENWIKAINVKDAVDDLIRNYQLILSLHCKQLFPDKLVDNVRCINIHPGLNPHNRGWFPQVFSIINGKPCGVTIHEIDSELDHGPIICQKEVPIHSWDTSFTVYNRVLEEEIKLLDSHLLDIIKANYTTHVPEEGNLNLKKDFNKLCEINLEDVDTFQNHINRLRALNHGEYNNAFFIDGDGNKVYLKLELIKG